jgi:hypothetical protein
MDEPFGVSVVQIFIALCDGKISLFLGSHRSVLPCDC